MNRQAERSLYRKLGAFVTAKLVPSAPRRMKRLLGRVYGNAAYRRVHELDHMLYGGTNHRHTMYSPHPDVISWIVKEGEKIIEASKAAQTPQEEVGESLQVGDGPSSGETEHPETPTE